MSSELSNFRPELSPRIIDWKEGKNTPPVTLMISPTDRCNHFCPECIGGRVGVQNLSNMENIIGQVADYGVTSIVFSGGGEPLLNPNTPSSVEYARARGMDVGLITNGSVALPESKLVQVLKNCQWIRISMDAATPEQYEHTHGMKGDALPRMFSNVSRMVDVRKSYGFMDCKMGAGYLTDEVTKDGMVAGAEACKEIGLDYIKFRPFFGDRTRVESEFENALRFADSGFQVLRSGYRYDTRPFELNDRGYKKCLSPNFETVISATGKVYICCHTIGKENYEIGDLNQASFREIWEDDRRQRVINSITFEDCPLVCKWHVLNTILDPPLQPEKNSEF